MKKKQQHPGGGADPWPHGAPLGGAPPGLGSWKRWVSQLPFLRLSLRDYGFCMATLLVFCLGSLFYQLSGGPPRFLLDLRQYLGKEPRQARGSPGRAKLCRGGGEGVREGGRGRAGVFGCSPPRPPPRGSPGGTHRGIGAAARGARCLLRGCPCGQVRGAGRAGTPGRGAAYLPTPPPPPQGRSAARVCGCGPASVDSVLAVRGDPRGRHSPPWHCGDHSPLLITVLSSRWCGWG